MPPGPRRPRPGPPPAPKKARAGRLPISLPSSLEEASPYLLRLQPPPSVHVGGASRSGRTPPAAEAAPSYAAAPPRGSAHGPNSRGRGTVCCGASPRVRSQLR
ncbi:hypothetical protein NDU88_005499 [Pleurodeles waltl]|uniref:Uncharacterized protein n=1 Tax=Pleurodeles waltl TaxID=8319 RepID=A0AAV7NP72_PLEWA|nr:hypothetical protein NDU88_005499 [Pleurodeles waltl]